MTTLNICNDCLDCITNLDFKINIAKHAILFKSNSTIYELITKDNKPIKLSECFTKRVILKDFDKHFLERLDELLNKKIGLDCGINSLQELDHLLINLNSFNNNYSVNSLFTDQLYEMCYPFVKPLMDSVFYHEHFSGFLFGEKDFYLNEAFAYSDMTFKDVLKFKNAKELCNKIFKMVFKSTNLSEGSACLDVVLVDFAYHLANEIESYEGTMEHQRVLDFLSKIDY